ncbi:MAG TPA: hypothetical protein PKY10_04740 [Lentisphaeria bacterium]|nr:hypothetical protein [Lentisphaeria bacterium]
MYYQLKAIDRDGKLRAGVAAIKAATGLKQTAIVSQLIQAGLKKAAGFDNAGGQAAATKPGAGAVVSFLADGELTKGIDALAAQMGGCSRAAVVRAAVAHFLNEKSAAGNNRG